MAAPADKKTFCVTTVAPFSTGRTVGWPSNTPVEHMTLGQAAEFNRVNRPILRGVARQNSAKCWPVAK